MPFQFISSLLVISQIYPYADFGMEVESASRVVDGAVVLIDSVEGVESQTKGVIIYNCEYHIYFWKSATI